MARGQRTAVLALAMLAACSQKSPTGSATARPEHIACRIGGAADFSQDCTVERSRNGGMETLIVHHPDGGFRRFDVLADGRGLAVADGATQAVTRYAGGFAELAVDGDAYRFPITVKAAPGDARPR